MEVTRRWVWEELEHPPCSPNISLFGFNLIPKIKEPRRGRRLATREDSAKDVLQQVTRFTHGTANAEAGGIQRFSHR
ncbi:hypothetical protein TNCV_2824831 [Trichonephila clavipes]|nr:hypothetical protein TNCV_2824831 [Trichonephila clavipes]